MRELAATGYTSNRGRQNVASLLAKVCNCCLMLCLPLCVPLWVVDDACRTTTLRQSPHALPCPGAAAAGAGAGLAAGC